MRSFIYFFKTNYVTKARMRPSQATLNETETKEELEVNHQIFKILYHFA